MVKVAWVSKHPILPAQERELRRIFGENVEIEHISKVFRDAEEVYRELRDRGVRAAVIILPLSMVMRLLRHTDIVWVWCEMDTIHNCEGYSCPHYDPRRDTFIQSRNGESFRHVRFRGFFRIKSIVVDLEPLVWDREG